MNKTLFNLIFGVVFCLTGSLRAAESTDGAEKELKAQKTCPIMGGAVNKDLYVDHDGKRIYVCCKGCIAPIKKNPEAAIKKLKELGEAPVAVPAEQKICPVMGGGINKKLFVEHDGKKIYVCCQACVNIVKKDPEKYAKKVAQELAAAQKDDGASEEAEGEKKPE